MDEENVTFSLSGSTDDDLGLMASITFDIPVDLATAGYDSFRCELTTEQIQQLHDALTSLLNGKDASINLDLNLLDYGG
jgi:hypothetical protein